MFSLRICAHETRVWLFLITGLFFFSSFVLETKKRACHFFLDGSSLHPSQRCCRSGKKKKKHTHAFDSPRWGGGPGRAVQNADAHVWVMYDNIINGAFNLSGPTFQHIYTSFFFFPRATPLRQLFFCLGYICFISLAYSIYIINLDWPWLARILNAACERYMSQVFLHFLEALPSGRKSIRCGWR